MKEEYKTILWVNLAWLPGGLAFVLSFHLGSPLLTVLGISMMILLPALACVLAHRRPVAGYPAKPDQPKQYADGVIRLISPAATIVWVCVLEGFFLVLYASFNGQEGQVTTRQAIIDLSVGSGMLIGSVTLALFMARRAAERICLRTK